MRGDQRFTGQNKIQPTRNDSKLHSAKKRVQSVILKLTFTGIEDRLNKINLSMKYCTIKIKASAGTTTGERGA